LNVFSTKNIFFDAERTVLKMDFNIAPDLALVATEEYYHIVSGGSFCRKSVRSLSFTGAIIHRKELCKTQIG
jgi:hypothetical protein